MTRVPGRPTMTRAPRGRQPLFFRRGRSRPWQCQLSRLAPAQLGRRHPRWPAKMLADYGTRWPHVRTAGFVAAQLTTLFDDDKAALLVAAATLHDIGYSKRIGRIGFHPLDGAIFLQPRVPGFPYRLAGLLAHHSAAVIPAPVHGVHDLVQGVHDLAQRFPQEQSLLVDALVYADMHSAPDGRIITTECRLADIARRHPSPSRDVRAELLRASIRRVEAAIRADPERRIQVAPPAPT